MMASKGPELAMVGGGTGSFTLLQHAKEMTPNISAIVNMSDDGGSSGELKDELGVLPPGDIRQCIVALSSIPSARELMSYRMGHGRFAGHTLGNIFLSDLESEHDIETAIDYASRLLSITGQVLPVTLQKHKLKLKSDSTEISGQYNIEICDDLGPNPVIYHEPSVRINPKASEAILSSDLLVIAPGNLYCSLIPALAVGGVKEAFQETKAKKVMVANLVNKPGQTDSWHVADYVRAVEEYVGEDQIDYVLYNTEEPAEYLASKYAAEGEHPVYTSPVGFNGIKAKAVGAPLVSSQIIAPNKSDKIIRRSLIRHDAAEACAKLLEIYEAGKLFYRQQLG